MWLEKWNTRAKALDFTRKTLRTWFVTCLIISSKRRRKDEAVHGVASVQEGATGMLDGVHGTRYSKLNFGQHFGLVFLPVSARQGVTHPLRRLNSAIVLTVSV
jgi:hypothetical protein